MKSFLLLFLLIASLSSSAQLNFNWLFTDSGSVNSSIYPDVALKNKNLVVIGRSDNGADIDPGPGVVSINSPFFIAGYSQQKTLVFARPFCYNGNLTGNIKQMIRDPSDNFYVSFNGQGPWDFDPAPGVGEFILPVMGMAIVKFDSIGNFKWAIPYDSSGTLIRSMVIQSDLSLLVLGEMEGVTDLDPDTGTWFFNSPNTANTFLAKYDSSGHLVTVKEFKTPGAFPNSCVSTEIVSTDAGDVFIQGAFAGTVDFDPGPGIYSLSASVNGGGYGMNFILKLDQNLDFDFVHEFYYEVGFTLFPGLNGDLLISGNCTVPIDLDFSPAVMMIDSQSLQCTFLAKYNSAGALLWVKTFYTNSSEYSPMYVRGIQQDGSMDIYLGLSGSILSNSFGLYDLTPSNTPYAYLYILRLDSTGTTVYNLLVTPPDWNLSGVDFSFTDPTHFYLFGAVHQDTSDVCIGPGIYPLSSINYSQFFISNYSFDYAVNSLRGNVYYDFDLNGTRDSSDIGVSNAIIQIQPGPVFVSTDNLGNYALYMDTGTFTIDIPSLPSHVTGSIPSNHSAVFTFPNQIDTANNFALQPTPGIADVKLALTEYGNARPGNAVHFAIIYSNPGTVLQSGTIELTLDSNLAYDSSSVIPSLVNGNTIQWNYGMLQPFQSYNIDVIATISPAAADSDSLISTAVIDPVIGDFFPSDNYDTSMVVVTSSFDPNSKSVSPEGPVGLSEIINGINLTYTIQFQNIGSDTAFTITILDTLSENLDLSQLTIEGVSHPYIFRLYPGRVMEFKFNNVLLPDSTTDEKNSHGFVKYRIKPKSSLVPGDNILNTASIYFDLNEPVKTNEVQTEVLFIVSTNELPSGNSFNIYPNPAKDKIYIDTKNKLHPLKQCRIYDSLGNLNLKFDCDNKFQYEINVGGLAPGIYFAEIIDSENNNSWTKISVIR